MDRDRHDRTERVRAGRGFRALTRAGRYALLSVVVAGLSACLSACLSSRCAADVPEPALQRYRHEHAAMGTLFVVTLYAESAAAAETAAAAAFARIDALERVATDYDATSEARTLSVRALGEGTLVSRDLARVIRAADAAVRASGGAFDPTVGALTRHWRRALRQREWPSQGRWDAARQAVGWSRLVRISESPEGLRVALEHPEMRLDFGGVAKGVAVDAALECLAAAGCPHALVDGGGDLAALRPPPDADGWRVAVRPFGDASQGLLTFELSFGAVATSGDAYQGATFSGLPLAGLPGEADPSARRFGHVIDPRTALPLPGPRAAVMTAASAAEADALATALMVAGQGAPSKGALQCGLFFDADGAPPCVGALFPQDGARLLPDGRAHGGPRDAARDSPLPRDE